MTCSSNLELSAVLELVEALACLAAMSGAVADAADKLVNSMETLQVVTNKALKMCDEVKKKLEDNEKEMRELRAEVSKKRKQEEIEEDEEACRPASVKQFMKTCLHKMQFIEKKLEMKGTSADISRHVIMTMQAVDPEKNWRWPDRKLRPLKEAFCSELWKDGVNEASEQEVTWRMVCSYVKWTVFRDVAQMKSEGEELYGVVRSKQLKQTFKNVQLQWIQNWQPFALEKLKDTLKNASEVWKVRMLMEGIVERWEEIKEYEGDVKNKDVQFPSWWANDEVEL